MPNTDDYGQGILITSNSDGPDMPRTAQQLADGLVPRSILRFASSSTRGATLAGDFAPVEGMLSWLQDVNRLDVYDGTTWVAVSTGSSAWTSISLASGFTNNGNSNGNLQYRLLNISGEESLQLRGAVNRTSYPASPPSTYVVNSTALPAAVRPSTLRSVLIPCSDTNSERIALKLDVRTDGFLEVLGFSTSVKPPWIGFNGTLVSL